MSFSLFRMPSFAFQSTEVTNHLRDLMQEPAVKRAFQYLDETADQATRELITVNEIPAPPFKEHQRATYVLNRFREFGLVHAHIDEEGNVLGVFPGVNDPDGTGPFLALAAHVDSVFPEGTDVTVHERDGRLYAPGIGDNASGLTGVLTLARCFTQAPLKTKQSILFVGTVGEEGPGNLRGVRYLFQENPYGKQITEFIAYDGPGIERITHQALGSRRYEVKFEGPGGHSWGDYGIVNPVHALGKFIHYMTSYHPPTIPRTTYSVSVVEGGTSVNTIPRSARCEVDLRSVSEGELDHLEQHLREAVKQAWEEEERSAALSRTRLKLTVTPMGNRPSGETPTTARLVRLAQAATMICGCRPLLDCSSTDSNLPISLSIPAITIGAGGRCNGCHTLDEWYEPTERELSLQRGILLLLGLVGLADKTSG
ncbi:MAG: M20/M25/M40 family metallo-hydrolase [Acidobacteria bacterium]|nr:M20/M25/M40 family metallo-hydrolase [Acidobacteriota bacterium]